VNVRVVLALGLMILAAVAAGCGGSKSPSVASLGTSAHGTSSDTATNGSSSAEPGSAASAGSGSAGLHSLIAGGGSVEQRTQYATCMRKNGVPNFPDPDAQGHFSISPTGGLDPRSAAFQHAQQGCQKLLPDAGQPSSAQEAQIRTELLSLAQCLRKHGYPNFPDPDSKGTFALNGASSVDPGSPQFQSAMSACRPGNGKVPVSIAIKTPSPPPGGKP
jgi:hypothetical protein